MPEPAGIAEEGLLAGERVDVRAANPAAAHAHERLAGGWHRIGNFAPRKLAGFL